MKKSNIRFMEKISQYKVKCSHCGHVMILISRNKVICNWCGHWIYRSKRDEFEDKLKKVMK